MNSGFSNGKVLIIKPGDRIIIPKQVEFIESLYKYDAVLYGGAAGSGKTYILIWALVLICIKLSAEFKKRGIKQIPRVVLFSNTYRELEDRHIKELPNYLPEWLGDLYRGTTSVEYRLKEEYGGGQILFRNLQDPSAYKSVQFAAIAFDEITEIEKWVFDEIMIRKRFSYVEHIPVLAATNPTGIGRGWVFDSFVSKESVKPKYIEEFDYWTKGYHFIQALPTDNPTLSKQYWAELHEKPPELRDAYLYGRWDAFQGQIYSLKPEVHRFSRNMEIPAEWPRYRAIDKGVAHPTCCLWGAVDFNGGLWIYREYAVTGQDALWHKPKIAKLSGARFEGMESVDVLGNTRFLYSHGGVPDDEENYIATVGDPEMWRDGHTGMEDISWEEVLNQKDEYGSLDMTRAKVSDVNKGLDDLTAGFAWEEKWINDDVGVARRLITRPPRIHISEDCEYTWKSVTNVSRDEHNPNKIKKYNGVYSPGEGDDELKCLMMMFRAINKVTATDAAIQHQRYLARRSGKQYSAAESRRFAPTRSKGIGWA